MPRSAPLTPVDSVKKRYIFSLVSNFISLLSNIVIMLIVPRLLGPANFGNYNFLYNFFNQAIGFLENGSSVALYTMLSKKNHDRTILTFYLSIIFFVLLAIVGFVVIVQVLDLNKGLWPHQEMKFVWLALSVSFFIWFISLLQKISDSHALTVSASILQVVSRAVIVIAILVIFFWLQLTLAVYFLFQLGSALLLVFLLLGLLIRKRLFTLALFNPVGVQWKSKWKDFWRFCSPFYLSAVASLIAGIASLWMLQKFSGSIQQGYYGLAMNIAAACFLFTSSIVSIFTREFAIAHSKHNLPEMQRLFKKYIPLFYAITAFFSVFVAINAKTLIEIVAGSHYQKALIVVMLMSLYPIHQTYGQLVASAYFAMGKTLAYRNVGLVTLSTGLLLSYFLLAPHDLLGLHLGAIGTAIQMLVIQFLGTNILVFFMAKALQLKYRQFLWNQLWVLIVFVILGAIAHWIGGSLFPSHNLINLMMEGVCYCLFILLAGVGLSVLILGVRLELVLKRMKKLLTR